MIPRQYSRAAEIFEAIGMACVIVAGLLAFATVATFLDLGRWSEVTTGAAVITGILFFPGMATIHISTSHNRKVRAKYREWLDDPSTQR